MNWVDILLTVFLLVVIDFPYLSYVSQYYFQSLGIRTYVGGFIVYILLAIGLLYFAGNDPKKAFLLGLFVYGIYDATNYATIPGWPVPMAWIDVAWGGVLLWTVTYVRNALLQTNLFQKSTEAGEISRAVAEKVM